MPPEPKNPSSTPAIHDMQQLVARIVENTTIPGDDDVQWTNAAKAAIVKITMAQLGQLAFDLDAFAKHAKRSMINLDDVKLAVRRNPALVERISRVASISSSTSSDGTTRKRKAGGSSKKKTQDPAPSADMSMPHCK